MLITTTVMTLALAVLLGLYMLAASVGLMLDPDRATKLVEDLERSPGLMYLLAVIAYAVGAVLVLFHNRWTDPLAVVITLIGWAALLEGMVLLAFPKLWFGMARPFMRHIRIFAIGTAVFGVALLVAGLTGRTYPFE